MVAVLVSFSIAVTEPHDPKQLGKERVYFSLLVFVHHEGTLRQGLKEGISRQEMRQRPWRKPHTGLLLMAYSAQTKGGTIHSGLGPPTSINNQENANRHTHRAIRKRFKFPGDSGLCHVNQSYPGLWHTGLGRQRQEIPGAY